MMPLVVRNFYSAEISLCLLYFSKEEELTLGWLKVILSVGTKLQAIITQMAVEIQERHAVVQGIPLIQVSDRYFWFGWPRLVLHLIHLTLFQVVVLPPVESIIYNNLSLVQSIQYDRSN